MILPQGKRGKMAMDNSNKPAYSGAERRSQVADQQEIITTRELVELVVMVKQLGDKIDDLSNEFKNYKREHDVNDGEQIASMERMYRKADTDINVLREDVKELKTWKKTLENEKTTSQWAKIKAQMITTATNLVTIGALGLAVWLITMYVNSIPKP